MIHAHAMYIAAQTVPAPASLQALRDKARPLLIFAPASDTRLQQQIDLLLKQESDLLDRQIEILPVDGDNLKGVVLVHDPPIKVVPDAAALRRRFHIHPADFTVILLGKDGGEKFRSSTPITIGQLNRIIDAMPMRQSEMRSRHQP